VARVVLARRACGLLDLDRALIDAIDDAFGMLAGDPRAGHALRGPLRRLWPLRIGAYRVIYQLIDADQTARSRDPPSLDPLLV
jgi:mRNA-degrading endonuclease RelE of RelBE toxin-antitoxin system